MKGRKIPVSIEFATIHGVDEAIVIQQLHFLLQLAAKRPDHYWNGAVWVWNSYEQWYREQIPCLSKGRIERALLSLERKGFVVSCQPSGYDRRKCYSIDYEAMGADAPGNCPWRDKRAMEGHDSSVSIESEPNNGKPGSSVFEGGFSSSSYIEDKEMPEKPHESKAMSPLVALLDRLEGGAA